MKRSAPARRRTTLRKRASRARKERSRPPGRAARGNRTDAENRPLRAPHGRAARRSRLPRRGKDAQCGGEPGGPPRGLRQETREAADHRRSGAEEKGERDELPRGSVPAPIIDRPLHADRVLDSRGCGRSRRAETSNVRSCSSRPQRGEGGPVPQAQRLAEPEKVCVPGLRAHEHVAEGHARPAQSAAERRSGAAGIGERRPGPESSATRLSALRARAEGRASVGAPLRSDTAAAHLQPDRPARAVRHADGTPPRGARSMQAAQPRRREEPGEPPSRRSRTPAGTTESPGPPPCVSRRQAPRRAPLSATPSPEVPTRTSPRFFAARRTRRDRRWYSPRAAQALSSNPPRCPREQEERRAEAHVHVALRRNPQRGDPARGVIRPSTLTVRGRNRGAPSAHGPARSSAPGCSAASPEDGRGCLRRCTDDRGERDGTVVPVDAQRAHKPLADAWYFA
jgi:hypothetical protein